MTEPRHPTPGEPTASGDAGAMAKTIQSLRAAIESRDKLIAEYQKRLAEVQRQSPRAGTAAAAPGAGEDSLTSAVERLEELTARRFDVLADGLQASQQVQRRLAEAAVQSYQLQLSQSARLSVEAGRRLAERAALDQLHAVSGDLAEDAAQIAGLDDPLAVLFLIDARRYASRLSMLQRTIRDRQLDDLVPSLVDVKEQAVRLRTALLAQVESRGDAPGALSRSLERLADDVEAERSLRDAVHQAGQEVARLTLEATEAGPEDADPCRQRVKTSRQKIDKLRERVGPESAQRVKRIVDFCRERPKLLQFYHHFRYSHVDLELTVEPEVLVKLTSDEGVEGVFWSGRDGRVYLHCLSRDRTYGLQWIGALEESAATPVELPEPSAADRLAWRALRIAGDSGVNLVELLAGWTDSLTLAERCLRVVGDIAAAAEQRREADAVQRQVGDLLAAAGSQDEKPERLHARARQLTQQLEEARQRLQSSDDAGLREVAALLEATPSLRTGTLSDTVASHLCGTSSVAVVQGLTSAIGQVSDFADRIALERLMAVEKQLLAKVQRVSRSRQKLMAQLADLPEPEESSAEEPLICPGCAEGWSAASLGSLRFGTAVRCPHCGAPSVLLAQLPHLLGRARRLQERFDKLVEQSETLTRVVGEHLKQHDGTAQRLLAAHPDWVHGEEAKAVAEGGLTPLRRAFDEELAEARETPAETLAGLEAAADVLSRLIPFVQYRNRFLLMLKRCRKALEESRQLDWPTLDAVYATSGKNRLGPLLQEKVYSLGGVAFAVRFDPSGTTGTLVDRVGQPIGRPFEPNTWVEITPPGSKRTVRIRAELGDGLADHLHAIESLEEDVVAGQEQLAAGRGPQLKLTAEAVDSPAWRDHNPVASEALDDMLQELIADGPSAVIRRQLGGALDDARDELKQCRQCLNRVAVFLALQSSRYRSLQIVAGLKTCARQMLRWAADTRPFWERARELLGGKDPQRQKVKLSGEKYQAYQHLSSQVRQRMARWERIADGYHEFIRAGDRLFDRLRSEELAEQFKDLRGWVTSDPGASARLLGNRPQYLGRIDPTASAAYLEATLNEFESANKAMEEAIDREFIDDDTLRAVEEFDQNTKDPWVT